MQTDIERLFCLHAEGVFKQKGQTWGIYQVDLKNDKPATFFDEESFNGH